jgi:hypothetical protein
MSKAKPSAASETTSHWTRVSRDGGGGRGVSVKGGGIRAGHRVPPTRRGERRG